MIGFRRLAEADLPLMHRWLDAPHVREHYDDHLADLAAVRTYYLPVIDGSDPTFAYVALIDDVAVGYLQTYRIADNPEYAAALALGVDAAGMDMFIGEAAYVHRGLGPEILTAFLEQIVWSVTTCDVCCIGPAETNTSAIRAYEKAGFVHLKTVPVPGEPIPEYLMLKPRGA